jgi:thiamine pyrophosphokinase
MTRQFLEMTVVGRRVTEDDGQLIESASAFRKNLSGISSELLKKVGFGRIWRRRNGEMEVSKTTQGLKYSLNLLACGTMKKWSSYCGCLHGFEVSFPRSILQIHRQRGK